MLSGFVAHHHRKLPWEQSHSLCEIVAGTVVHSATHHGSCEEPQGVGLVPSPGKKTFIVKEFSCFFAFFIFGSYNEKEKYVLRFDLVPGHLRVQLYVQMYSSIKTIFYPNLKCPAVA